MEFETFGVRDQRLNTRPQGTEIENNHLPRYFYLAVTIKVE